MKIYDRFNFMPGNFILMISFDFKIMDQVKSNKPTLTLALIPIVCLIGLLSLNVWIYGKTPCLVQTNSLFCYLQQLQH